MQPVQYQETVLNNKLSTSWFHQYLFRSFKDRYINTKDIQGSKRLEAKFLFTDCSIDKELTERNLETSVLDCLQQFFRENHLIEIKLEPFHFKYRTSIKNAILFSIQVDLVLKILLKNYKTFTFPAA